MRAHVNLLPVSYLRRQIMRRRCVQWSTLMSLVLLAGWGWHWNEVQEDRALARQLESLNREYGPIRRLLQQLVSMREKLKQLHQHEQVARELERKRNVLTVLGLVSHAARKSDGLLRLTKLELTNFQGASTHPAGSGSASSALSLIGVALENSAVGELLDGLQDSRLFSRVELLAAKEREEASISLRDYEVRCEF